jgi:CRP-like cAMP-binding protein
MSSGHILRQFLQQFRATAFPKGQLIFGQNEVPVTAYAVQSGIVKVYNLTGDGKEMSIAYKLRDDIFPLGWLFSRQVRTLYFYEAHTDCVLYHIPKEAFSAALDAQPELSRALLEYLVSEQISDGLRFNALEQTQSRDKIIGMLQAFCLRYGMAVGDNAVRLDLQLRQQDIASLLGLTRETVALELRRLKNEGVVRYDHLVHIVRTDKLGRLLSDAYNPGVDIQP